MAGRTEYCQECAGVLDGSEEFYYEREFVWHVACKPREGIDMEDETKRATVTMSKRGETNGREWAFFKIDGKNDRDDPSYSIDTRQAGFDMPDEGDYIWFTFRINGKYRNVQTWERAVPPAGEVAKVAATVSATETAKNTSIHASVAVQEGPGIVRDFHMAVAAGLTGVTFDMWLADVTKATHRLHTLLGDNPTREVGAPKPVADTNPPRGEDGRVMSPRAQGDAELDADEASLDDTMPRDAQGRVHSDPKYVGTGT